MPDGSNALYSGAIPSGALLLPSTLLSERFNARLRYCRPLLLELELELLELIPMNDDGECRDCCWFPFRVVLLLGGSESIVFRNCYYVDLIVAECGMCGEG